MLPQLDPGVQVGGVRHRHPRLNAGRRDALRQGDLGDLEDVRVVPEHVPVGLGRPLLHHAVEDVAHLHDLDGVVGARQRPPAALLEHQVVVSGNRLALARVLRQQDDLLDVLVLRQVVALRVRGFLEQALEGEVLEPLHDPQVRRALAVRARRRRHGRGRGRGSLLLLPLLLLPGLLRLVAAVLRESLALRPVPLGGVLVVERDVGLVQTHRRALRRGDPRGDSEEVQHAARRHLLPFLAGRHPAAPVVVGAAAVAACVS
mmetsp:Transcript_29011/g.61246  ORF Transcript_29011/g.61246 Transcript_29011/m.61246 type:complete len:260 (-) Transcript_29011:196-975(-)